MRGHRETVHRCWRAVGAMAVAFVLVSCSSSGDASQPRAAQLAAQPTAGAPAGPVASTKTKAKVGVPRWLPAVLPMPEGASVTGVRAKACSVDFLVPATDALVEAAKVGDAAREAGLDVRVVSSVSATVPRGDHLSVAEDAWGEELVVEEFVDTHAVVLRLKRAEGADGGAVEALLTLTSSGDGVVSGDYQLVGSACLK